MSRQAHLFMVRPNLAGIAEPALPEGFRLRSYRPGDEAAWLKIIRLGYDSPSDPILPGGDWPDDAFQRHMLSDASFRPERLFFAEREGGPCLGVAAALQSLLHGDRTGYVHMMTVLPEFRRRGLGAALLARCLLCFREEGRRDAVLDTDVARLPAIRLYLAHGFEPFPEVEPDLENWRTVLAALGRHDLSAALRLKNPVS